MPPRRRRKRGPMRYAAVKRRRRRVPRAAMPATRKGNAPEAIERPRLQRVPPIALAVRDVVHEIDDARQRAEHHERRYGVEDGRRVKQALAEQQAGEDEEILGPLGRTQGEEQVQGERAPRHRVDCSAGSRHGG